MNRVFKNVHMAGHVDIYYQCDMLITPPRNLIFLSAKSVSLFVRACVRACVNRSFASSRITQKYSSASSDIFVNENKNENENYYASLTRTRTRTKNFRRTRTK